MSKIISGYGMTQMSFSMSKSKTYSATFHRGWFESKPCWWSINPNPVNIPTKPKTKLVKTRQVDRLLRRFLTDVNFVSCESLIPSSLALLRSAPKESMTFCSSCSFPVAIILTLLTSVGRRGGERVNITCNRWHLR